MEETKKEKVKPTRIIGIDYGMARIGLAMSDEQKIIATSLATISCEKKTDHTADKVLAELYRQQELKQFMIEEIVIGMPLMMSGKTGFLADEVKYFIEVLKKKTSIPLIPWDERLTTVQADRTMRESSLSRKKRSQKVDAVAAVIILQNYLDHKKNKSMNELI